MGWNEPNKPKDPWGNNKQPPDLDEALKRLQAKFKKMFGSVGKSNNSNNNSSSSSEDGGGMGFLAAGIGVIILILWALSGIFIVDPAEQAAILYFGKYTETVGPGPHWIPRFIANKVVLNVDRVLDYSYSGQMLTNDENLVAVSVAVQYRIGDLQEYLFNVADPQESLQQATSSALRQVIGTTTLDKIITEGREVWGSSVQESLIKTLQIYKTGIVIVNVSPQPARAPESVQDAFDDAIKAQEDEKRFKEQAYAYAARVVPIATGNAKRITQESEAFSKQAVLKAQGEVAEFLALLPEYNNDSQIITQRMYLDTMQRIFGRTAKIVVDGKSGNMLYLPLDKMLAAQKDLPNLVPTMVKSSINSDADNAMLPERSAVRRTYENEGNE